MGARLKITGKRFAMLTAMNPTALRVRGKVVWLFKCDCGNETSVGASQVINGNTRSCGCIKLARVKALKYSHGMAKTKINHVWARMKQRCLNPKCSDYEYYGGRGITVCERWLKFENFFSDMGQPEPGMTLERVDNSKGYEPGNVIWASRKVQGVNMRSNVWIEVNGRCLTRTGWAKELGVHDSAIISREKKGMTPEQAVTIPFRKRLA